MITLYYIIFSREFKKAFVFYTTTSKYNRNKNKYNLFTPGTKIKIISENLSRFYKPDYYLVLPWHFKKEILNRESIIRKKGTKFIFPLPKLRVI